MILKDDWIVATVGNIVMRSKQLGIGNEYVLDPTAVIGWTDGVSTRRNATERSTGFGDFYEKATLSSRSISFSGTAIAKSPNDLQVMRDSFIGLLANGEYSQLEVQTSSGSRFSTVGLEGSPSWIQKLDTVAVWRLDLYAPDPRIYGLERRIQLGGGIPATGMSYPIRYPLNYGNRSDSGQSFIGNAGNSISWPTFVAQGLMPYGFVIHNNLGRTVRYLGVVTPQSPVIIDMSSGTATQNGIDKTILIDVRDWISIPAYGSINPGFDPIRNGLEPVNAAWCDIIVKDTWI